MLYVARYRDGKKYRTALINTPGKKKALVYFNRTHKRRDCELVALRENRGK